tara:strand:+ start:5979 stop:6833 length:855 start_codon:yes stop_codon:yes gene_type:complete
MAAAALIGAGVQILGGLLGMGAARRAEEAARDERKRLQDKLTSLESSRQEITNPYASSKDLSSTMSNPYAQLGVATQAAEMQVEQADISLANTLDTIRSTGASAGGATALAQAALQSKKGVSANIEQQEAANEKLKAQGEQNLQQRQTAEKQRMQNVDAQGNIFTFNATEKRQDAQIDRTAGQLDNASAQEMQAAADRTGAMTGMISGLGGVAGSYMNNQSALAVAEASRPTTSVSNGPPVIPSATSTSSFNMLDESNGFGTAPPTPSPFPAWMDTVNWSGFRS